jgi:NAD(P)H-hydrate repair Nnr-like enzyme with NAD(P)H-hydrate dehydratase domain
MEAITSSRMAAIDENCKYLGTKRLQLMENVGMTVSRTGDVLAGLTGALFARHNAFEAAYAAAFINGATGDMAFAEFGYGLLATDVIDNIPGVNV